MSPFRALLRKLTSWLPTREIRYSPLSPLYKTPSLTLLNADDVYDAVTLAEQGDTSRLFPLYDQIVIENSHLQAALCQRKLAVLGDPLQVTAASEDPADDAARQWVDDWVNACPEWLDVCIALLDSTLWPVSVVQKWYEPGTNGRRYTLRMERVDPELFDFTTGKLRIFDVVDGVRQGTSHELDREHYIVHRGHLLTQPDNWGGPMRSLLGWHLLANASPEWWGRFLERLGAPFLVGHVGSGDDADRERVEAAFSQALRLFGIVVSEGTRIEMMQAQSSQTGEAHERLHDKCCREISKLISGQTSTSDSQKSGMNSGQADVHNEVRHDYRDWDAARLCACLMSQAIAPLLAVNGITGRPPVLSFGTANSGDDIATSIALLNALPTAGLSLTDDGIAILSERTGLPLVRSGPADVASMLSAESRQTLFRRAGLIADAQLRLASATVPRLARAISAADVPDSISADGAEIFLDYLSTSTLQGQ